MQCFSAKTLTSVARYLLIIEVAALIAGAAGLVVLHARGLRILSVQTASMIPAFRPGDALIVEHVSTIANIQIGDIVSYRNPSNPNVIISHRLMAVDARKGLLTTAGDVTGSADVSFNFSAVSGRAIALAPKFGLVIDFLRRPIGLAVTVYVPACLIIGMEIKRLATHIPKPYYRLKVSR